MPSGAEDAASKLLDIWLDDDLDETEKQQRALGLREEFHQAHPESLYGDVLRGAFDMLCEYRQAHHEIDDITAGSTYDEGQQ